MMFDGPGGGSSLGFGAAVCGFGFVAIAESPLQFQYIRIHGDITIWLLQSPVLCEGYKPRPGGIHGDTQRHPHAQPDRDFGYNASSGGASPPT